MFVPMDRLYEIENLRRSLAMLPPKTKALDREEAMNLLAELHEVESRLRNLRDALRAVFDHGPDSSPPRSPERPPSGDGGAL